MSYKIDRIGRGAAVVTSLILFALLLNLRIIYAVAHESESPLPQLHNSAAAEEAGQREESGPFTESGSNQKDGDGVSRLLDKVSLPFGSRPIAYVSQGELYVLDSRGKILGRADSLKVRDLPMIDGKSIKLDLTRRCLADEAGLEALELLRQFESHPDVLPLISGVHVQNGSLIAYMNFGRLVPVIFGLGNLKDKIDNLVDYYHQLGADDLTRKAKYLDLRVEDRVVVKKNV
jgi:hypothetical protein